MKRPTFVATAAALAVVLTASTAAAVRSTPYTDTKGPGQYGALMRNQCDSNMSIRVYNSGYYGSVPKCYWADNWSTFRDVDAMFVGAWDKCWNPYTGVTVYGGQGMSPGDGRWWWFYDGEVNYWKCTETFLGA